MTALPYRKKLIEVALPLDAINKASAREKSIRHGHPSTLHLWWARRPLAACRAVLFASLVDDPDSDPAFAGDPDAAAERRAELFEVIEDLVLWENTNNESVINRARAEIAASIASRKIELEELAKDQIIHGPKKGKIHPAGPLPDKNDKSITGYQVMLRQATPEAVNEFLKDHAPPVLDPFCGGGSIPLEAQRLGLEAHASDLNPVAVLITKAMIEIPPKFAGLPPVNPEYQALPDAEKKSRTWKGAAGLAEDVRYYGKWMRDEAEKRIGYLYPKVKITKEMAKDRPDLEPYVGRELTVIAWLWARTVPSPDPAARGAHIPLVRSWWLYNKKGKQAFVIPIVDRTTRSFRFEVRVGNPSHEAFDPGRGTLISRRGAECLLTGAPIPFAEIRNASRIGGMGATMLGSV